MTHSHLLLLLFLTGTGPSATAALPAYRQAAQADTIVREHTVDEVVVTSRLGKGRRAVAKGQLASMDEHLSRLSHVNMVRRGTYAWEPVVNSMSTERVATTIDGMKIFYACTDKMDPVTAYVESGNLQRISLNSGLDGNPQATGNIGGSIDLKLRRAGFDGPRAAWNASAGYETNGHVQAYALDGALSSHRLYANFGSSWRHADDYRAGGRQRVPYSQFQKSNAFVNAGWRPGERQALEATLIYDLATDVGYPALNMDVKRAEAVITSLSYRRERVAPWLDRWETKVYYNHITHTMDDTKRPDVLLHMDMPGRSHTGGLYSLVQGSAGQHAFQLNWDGYYNALYADMTMYPGGGKPMFMLTWPDVGTLNTGLALTDDISLGGAHHLRLSAKGAWQRQHVGSDEGFQALSIYFPGMGRSRATLLGRVAASYAYEAGSWHGALGTGWGSRAPTVTEAFGYFLNNTFDRYDYIGNPRLDNEQAVELNGLLEWSRPWLTLKAEANAFFFRNYIIGRPDERLSAMTIGAAGVKIYQNLRHARIVNTTLSADATPLPWLRWENRLTYSYGKESTGARLPLVAPLTWQTTLRLTRDRLEAELGGLAAIRHNAYSPSYGEQPTAGYGVWSLSAAYRLPLAGTQLTLRAGAENLLDHGYSTYSDWNHIPQKGRNVYLNATLSW